MKTNRVVKKEEEKVPSTTGGVRAHESFEQQLERVTLATLLFEQNAYCDGQQVADSIMELVPKCNGAFVSDLAIKVRTEQKIRHTPLLLLVAMCKSHKEYVKSTMQKVILRADELTEFLAIYYKFNPSKKLSAQAKKGLSDCVHNFDEYSFGKYKNGDIKFHDLFNLVHPKARNQEEQVLFKKIIDNKLEVPDTWETQLSAGKDKKETFTRLLRENKLGALAFIRNLRNMRESGVSDSLVLEKLSTLNTRWLLPTNFYTAYKTNPDWKKPLEVAFLRGLSEQTKLPGKTILILDVSGSMDCALSSKNSLNRRDAGALLLAVAREVCEESSLWITGNNHIKLNPSLRGFDLVDEVAKRNNEAGYGGIYTARVLEHIKRTESADRIIVFSDSQDCDGDRIPYPFGKTNYIINVSSERYGVNFKQSHWTSEISGFSDKFLQYIYASEGNSLVFEEE